MLGNASDSVGRSPNLGGGSGGNGGGDGGGARTPMLMAIVHMTPAVFDTKALNEYERSVSPAGAV